MCTTAGHKGYCVPEHVEAIKQHGPCPEHRRTFAPIKHWFPREEAASAGAAGEADVPKKAEKTKSSRIGRKVASS